jgi:hypothetical protein
MWAYYGTLDALGRAMVNVIRACAVPQSGGMTVRLTVQDTDEVRAIRHGPGVYMSAESEILGMDIEGRPAAHGLCAEMGRSGQEPWEHFRRSEEALRLLVVLPEYVGLVAHPMQRQHLGPDLPHCLPLPYSPHWSTAHAAQ